jgi:hypothetical protein
LALWLLSLLGLVPLLGFALRYTGGYFEARFGRSQLERQLSLGGSKAFRPSFLEFCERVRRATPADARILVEPSEIKSQAGSARWFLYLNLELHPRQVFVRQPLLASGTLVDYPRWLEACVKPLTFTESVALMQSMANLGIGWRIRYPVTGQWKLDSIEFNRRTAQGWETQALQPAGILRGRLLPATDDAAEEEEQHAF